MKCPGDVALLLALLLAASRWLPAAESVTCSPYELVPCAPVMFGTGNPSPLCCTKLRGQRPCLCQYIRDPSLRRYLNAPNARHVAAVCGVPYPRC